MTNNNYYIVSLGGAAGVFYIKCKTKEEVRQEIKYNADGYYKLTIWEMANKETALRRCKPSEF